MTVFAWWTWRLHEAHSAWQWLTGFVAFTGFASMMGSRTPIQPPNESAATEEPTDASELEPAEEERRPGDEPNKLAPRRAS